MGGSGPYLVVVIIQHNARQRLLKILLFLVVMLLGSRLTIFLNHVEGSSSSGTVSRGVVGVDLEMQFLAKVVATWTEISTWHRWRISASRLLTTTTAVV